MKTFPMYVLEVCEPAVRSIDIYPASRQGGKSLLIRTRLNIHVGIIIRINIIGNSFCNVCYIFFTTVNPIV